jgi:hypothetical protein
MFYWSIMAVVISFVLTPLVWALVLRFNVVDAPGIFKRS